MEAAAAVGGNSPVTRGRPSGGLFCGKASGEAKAIALAQGSPSARRSRVRWGNAVPMQSLSVARRVPVPPLGGAVIYGVDSNFGRAVF